MCLTEARITGSYIIGTFVNRHREVSSSERFRTLTGQIGVVSALDICQVVERLPTYSTLGRSVRFFVLSNLHMVVTLQICRRAYSMEEVA